MYGIFVEDNQVATVESSELAHDMAQATYGNKSHSYTALDVSVRPI